MSDTGCRQWCCSPGLAALPQLLHAGAHCGCRPKLEIAHAHRPPAKRIPAMVALAATAACVAPLGVLLVLLTRMGANIKVRGATRASPTCSARRCKRAAVGQCTATWVEPLCWTEPRRAAC